MLWFFLISSLSFAVLTHLGLFICFLPLIFASLLLLHWLTFLRGLFQLSHLLLFSLDDFQLCIELLLEVVLDGLKRVLQLVEGNFLEFDCLVILEQLTAQIVRVLLALVLDDLLHLLEHGLILFV